MKDIDGHIEPITSATRWLDLVFRSDLDYAKKLVAAAVARTCVYNRKHKMSLSSISIYSISRVLQMSTAETVDQVEKMIELGWLFDTEIGAGATKVYALTFSLIPLGGLRT